jgi:hypothetical protein
MENNVGRLMAEEDLRRFRLMASVNAQKSAEETSRVLAKEMGTVLVENAVRDEMGFNRLKGIANRGK